MAIKLIQVISIVLVSMVSVSNAIKCYKGGKTQTGEVIQETEFNCTSKGSGITYKDKCFVMQFKNCTSNFIERGCVRNIPGEEANICKVNIERKGDTRKGCCCDGNLCNDEDFQNKCTGTSSGRALSTNIIVISLMFAIFKFLIN